MNEQRRHDENALQQLQEECAELVATDAITFRPQFPLSKRTTFGIGGPADMLLTVSKKSALPTVLCCIEKLRLPYFFLGGGSNLLVGDGGMRGVVLFLDEEFSQIHVEEEGEVISVGAATSFAMLTRTAIEQGWPSAVGWAGTPGQVGGALVMNAGSRWGEIGDTVEFVEGVWAKTEIDPQTQTQTHTAGDVVLLPKDQCGFAYRRSHLATLGGQGFLLTGARLQCRGRKIDEAPALAEKVRELEARRKATQPKGRCAGSIFKNPPAASDGSPQFAGQLIERAGLKGLRVGGAEVSTLHANFIVNVGNATAKDVVDVATQVQQKVFERFGVMLEWEVKRVGEFL